MKFGELVLTVIGILEFVDRSPNCLFHSGHTSGNFIARVDSDKSSG